MGGRCARVGWLLKRVAAGIAAVVAHRSVVRAALFTGAVEVERERLTGHQQHHHSRMSAKTQHEGDRIDDRLRHNSNSAEAR